ncbi:MAG: hypothetical protein ABFR82_02740 [Nitrospirota bacterium]
MAILRNGQWKAPFWGAEKSFITGQDMLGMQNTSIATYGVLVPGLTNLTKRIRYYGFYTWILEHYAKRVGTVSVSEFQKFIRRAELLLAYMMTDQFPDTKGVVGKKFAGSTLGEYLLEIDLAKGADRLENGALYMQEALEILQEEIVGELQDSVSLEDVGTKTFQELAVAVHATGYEPFEEISTIKEEGKEYPEKAAAKALMGLARMHIHIDESIKELTEYSRLYRMDREGDCLSFFVWMKKHQYLPVGEFLKKLLLHKIINRHLEVAMRKMSNRNENTLKFIFEDNQLKPVSTFPPVFTTPRIPSLHYFLEDTGFIKQDSRKLTPDGTTVIEGGIDG